MVNDPAKVLVPVPDTVRRLPTVRPFVRDAPRAVRPPAKVDVPRPLTFKRLERDSELDEAKPNVVNPVTDN